MYRKTISQQKFVLQNESTAVIHIFSASKRYLSIVVTICSHKEPALFAGERNPLSGYDEKVFLIPIDLLLVR